MEFLNPIDWFTRGHDLNEEDWENNVDGFSLPCVRKGTFIWTPAPCTAEAAVEELRKARHKRQESQHLFIVPRLMTPLWRKHLHKAADLVLCLNPGHPAWPEDMLEPLTLAFVFPFIRCKPWQLRGSIQLMALGREVYRVWSEDHRREGPVLWKLWSFQKWIESLPPKLAWRVLQSECTDIVSCGNSRKRRRCKVEEAKGGEEVFKRPKR